MKSGGGNSLSLIARLFGGNTGCQNKKICYNSDVRYHYYERKLILKKGFTLAEVLITLGIIGIVAALTLPNLIANYRKNVAETHLKRVVSTLNEAFKFAQLDYGEAEYWELLGSPDFIKKYLMPYVPGSSFIGESQMGAIQVETYDGKSSFALSGGWSSGFKLKTGEVIGVQTADPAAPDFIGYQLKILLQENKYKRYISGKDYFVLYFNPKRGVVDNISTWGEHWNADCSKVLHNSSEYNRCVTSGGHAAACAMIIQCNGWNIPDDYPIRF